MPTAAERCPAEDKPDTEVECPATPACPAWQAEAFACPEACDTNATTLTRQVRCLVNGTVVVDRRCTGTRPAATHDCAATPACLTYAWAPADFAECPSECGAAASVLERDVACVGSDGAAAADANCDEEDKPASTTDCDATPACVTYMWVAPDFDDCPTECGLASETLDRPVTCVGSDGSVAEDDARCTAEQPATTFECPVTARCRWTAEPFADCPTSCGLAATPLGREVLCADPADESIHVEEARCNFDDKPATGRMCDATEPCVTYAWQAEEFAACASACGRPSTALTRTVACMGDDGTVAADAASCTGPKPPDSRQCDATEACDPQQILAALSSANSSAVVAEIVFNYDIEMFGVGTSQRTAFEEDVVAELARFLSIAPGRIDILQMKAGTLVVIIAVYPGGAGEPSASEAVRRLAASMHQAERVQAGSLPRGSGNSSVLLDESAYPHLSVLRMGAGVQTDVSCEIGAGGQLDCDRRDPWSVVQDEVEDFVADPVGYARCGEQCPYHYVYLGVGGAAVLALLCCGAKCLRRCGTGGGATALEKRPLTVRPPPDGA